MLGKKRGLGKGLDSLLSSSSSSRQKQVSYDADAEKNQQLVDNVKGTLTSLDVNSLQAGKYQPRREMDNNALEELANSIRAQGIIQPIVVRETGHQKYEIIAGERRWRAAKLVGLENIPCLIKNVEDNAAIAIALIENIQRENLNAMEEAIALKRLLEEFKLTHIEVAQAVGKSRTTISNLLRLNNLNEDVKVLLEHGDIEMGHARALLSCEDEQQLVLAQIVVAKSLTVRKTEL
ncbi:MAG TPA: ParB/RepB/Spo0J family partition protein, partial [Psychromonas sp.]